MENMPDANSEILDQRSKVLAEHSEAKNVLENHRSTMKQMTEKRKILEAERERIEHILSTPDYYKKRIQKRIQNLIWFRLLVSVMLVAFTFPITTTTGLSGTSLIVVRFSIITIGLVIIWQRQFAPISQTKLEKRRLIDTEREKNLREQIINCEMQLTSLNAKLETYKQNLYELERKLSNFVINE